MKIHNITTYNKLEYFKFQNKICINYKKTFLLEKKENILYTIMVGKLGIMIIKGKNINFYNIFI